MSGSMLFLLVVVLISVWAGLTLRFWAVLIGPGGIGLFGGLLALASSDGGADGFINIRAIILFCTMVLVGLVLVGTLIGAAIATLQTRLPAQQ